MTADQKAQGDAIVAAAKDSKIDFDNVLGQMTTVGIRAAIFSRICGERRYFVMSGIRAGSFPIFLKTLRLPTDRSRTFSAF